MGDMIEVDFSSIAPEIMTPLRDAHIDKVLARPKRCKHPHCGRIIEKFFDYYVHEDGSRKCRATVAEPEEE